MNLRDVQSAPLGPRRQAPLQSWEPCDQGLATKSGPVGRFWKVEKLQVLITVLAHVPQGQVILELLDY